MAGGISLHAVDVASGQPATGMWVELWLVKPQEHLVGQGRLGLNGQLEHPSARGEGVTAGLYEARFHLGAWLRERSGADASPFLDMLPFRFIVANAAEHIHLPLKFTAWGYALFRGT